MSIWLDPALPRERAPPSTQPGGALSSDVMDCGVYLSTHSLQRGDTSLRTLISGPTEVNVSQLCPSKQEIILPLTASQLEESERSRQILLPSDSRDG